ncbi:flagellar biosynthesis chaperone [compost metagenome]
MKFKFPLQKVLEHRKIVENLAQKDFQEVQMLLNTENEKLTKMEQDMHEAQITAGALSSEGGNQGPALSQIHEFLRGQRIRITTQRFRIAEVEKLVEAKRDILRQAAVDYKIIEKMRENKFEEYRQGRLIEDQKEMDEQAILRFKSTKDS